MCFMSRSNVTRVVATICLSRTLGGWAAELVEVPSAPITIIDSVDVAAANSGVLTSAPIREGQLVSQGQELARVDDRMAALKAVQAEVNLQLANEEAGNDVAYRLSKKTHQVAVGELARAKKMNQNIPGSVSEAEVILLQLAVDKAELEMENAQHKYKILRLTAKLREADLQLAEHERDRYAIQSPLNGMVIRLDRRAGEWVESGTVLARLVRVDRLRAEGFVKAELTTQGLIGREVTMKVGDPLRQVAGEVVFVNPEANPVTGVVSVWAEFPNSDLTLRPGLRGTMVIHDSSPRKRRRRGWASGRRTEPIEVTTIP